MALTAEVPFVLSPVVGAVVFRFVPSFSAEYHCTPYWRLPPPTKKELDGHQGRNAPAGDQPTGLGR